MENNKPIIDRTLYKKIKSMDRETMNNLFYISKYNKPNVLINEFNTSTVSVVDRFTQLHYIIHIILAKALFYP